MGVAKQLMEKFEDQSKADDCYFCDLFVRASNAVAIEMYEHLGYSTYRRVVDYYSMPDEDAFGNLFLIKDMRKALPKDKEKTSIIPLGRPAQPYETVFQSPEDEDDVFFK